jgi:hypothetical protein
MKIRSIVLALILIAILAGLAGCGVEVYYDNVQTEYLVIRGEGSAVETYLHVGPDGVEYEVRKPRYTGCYYLFPPKEGALRGTAIWFAYGCPTTPAQPDGKGF